MRERGDFTVVKCESRREERFMSITPIWVLYSLKVGAEISSDSELD
jgi:hypothetical protein